LTNHIDQINVTNDSNFRDGMHATNFQRHVGHFQTYEQALVWINSTVLITTPTAFGCSMRQAQMFMLKRACVHWRTDGGSQFVFVACLALASNDAHGIT